MGGFVRFGPRLPLVFPSSSPSNHFLSTVLSLFRIEQQQQEEYSTFPPTATTWDSEVVMAVLMAVLIAVLISGCPCEMHIEDFLIQSVQCIFELTTSYHILPHSKSGDFPTYTLDYLRSMWITYTPKLMGSPTGIESSRYTLKLGYCWFSFSDLIRHTPLSRLGSDSQHQLGGNG